MSEWRNTVNQIYKVEPITFSIRLKKGDSVKLWSKWVKHVKPLQSDFVEITLNFLWLFTLFWHCIEDLLFVNLMFFCLFVCFFPLWKKKWKCWCCWTSISINKELPKKKKRKLFRLENVPTIGAGFTLATVLETGTLCHSRYRRLRLQTRAVNNDCFDNRLKWKADKPRPPKLREVARGRLHEVYSNLKFVK